MASAILNLLLLGATTSAGAGMLAAIGNVAEQASEQNVTITARQYAFDPPVIRANRGDTLHIKLTSADVVHGFYLEGHDVEAQVHAQDPMLLVRHPSKGGETTQQEEVVVKLDRTGKYRFRCSHTCGYLHPFMSGELIVAPNHLYHAGLGSVAGLLLGFAALAWRNRVNARSNSKKETDESDSGDSA